MANDDFYASLYRRKKEYYMKTARKVWLNGAWVEWPPFEEILADPSRCPKYGECRRRLAGRAERLGREPKRLPCRGHLDAMAKRFLAGILVSNAAELMRRAEGLDVSNYLSHRNYIGPKP